MKYLNDKFQNLGLVKFLTIGGILCLISDISNIAYINLYWLNKHITITALKNAIILQGVSPNMIPPHELEEFRQVAINTFSGVFFLFLIYHAFVYFKFARNKNWAKKYVKGYGITTTILTLIELPFLFPHSIMWGTIMLLTTITYFITFQGVRYFNKTQEQ